MNPDETTIVDKPKTRKPRKTLERLLVGLDPTNQAVRSVVSLGTITTVKAEAACRKAQKADTTVKFEVWFR